MTKNLRETNTVADMFLLIKAHRTDIPFARFKIGEEVIYNSRITGIFKKHAGKRFIVTGVNWADTDLDGRPVLEYSLRGIPFLVWEKELNKIETTMNLIPAGVGVFRSVKTGLAYGRKFIDLLMSDSNARVAILDCAKYHNTQACQKCIKETEILKGGLK